MAYILEKSFPVEAGAYTTAGEASTTIKRTLKQLGISAEVLRHVSVACYEVELNLVIHSMGGTLTLLVDPEKVTLISKDVGPGIPDIEKAMTEGFSTASAEARTLGFGAGMGLPNMKRNATEFDIQSEVGVGTTVVIHEEGEDEPETYMIVGAPEVDLMANKISNESPIGMAVMGHHAGETVEVQAPAGSYKITIIEVK